MTGLLINLVKLRTKNPQYVNCRSKQEEQLSLSSRRESIVIEVNKEVELHLTCKIACD
jgi:hypothetical protein